MIVICEHAGTVLHALDKRASPSSTLSRRRVDARTTGVLKSLMPRETEGVRRIAG